MKALSKSSNKAEKQLVETKTNIFKSHNRFQQKQTD